MACMTPFTVLVKTKNEKVAVPCGKCPDCKARRASAWSFRLIQEAKYSDNAHFITLTYDGDNIPLTEKGYMEIRKIDLQLFFKRLRRSQENRNNTPRLCGRISQPIRYYAVGEYGGTTLRPHYHIILFNCDIELISPAWGKGHVHYGKVSGASVGYTLKYISKPGKIPMHRNDDRQKEFSLMSKGLGKSYLTPGMVQWHLNDLENRMYLNIEEGKKIAMPRYYKEKIYSNFDRKVVGYFQQAKILKKLIQDQKEQGDLYWHNQYSGIQAAFNNMARNAAKLDKL